MCSNPSAALHVACKTTRSYRLRVATCFGVTAELSQGYPVLSPPKNVIDAYNKGPDILGDSPLPRNILHGIPGSQWTPSNKLPDPQNFPGEDVYEDPPPRTFPRNLKYRVWLYFRFLGDFLGGGPRGRLRRGNSVGHAICLRVSLGTPGPREE